jgi:hypothetical protein
MPYHVIGKYSMDDLIEKRRERAYVVRRNGVQRRRRGGDTTPLL